MDTSLIESLKQSDPTAWRRLTQIYGPAVYAWCRDAGLQGADAADVGQEVFRSVHVGIAKFRSDREGDNFRGWLWMITRRKITDHWRRRKSEPVALGGTTAQRRMADLPAAEPGSNVGNSGQGDTVERRAAELLRPEFSEQTWQSFWRLAVKREPAAQVADELGVSRNAVYLAKSRVLRRLREEYGELLG